MSRPLKPPMSTRDHIALLRQRGMEVDEAQATQWLSNVSYHRLAAYWYPARRLTAGGRREDSFVDGTSFADVAALYEADRKLRSLVLDGMERVEITMRTRIGELLCQSDPLLYRDPSRFRPGFDHSRWVATAQSRIKRAQRRDAAIQHYRDNYDANYPFWVLAEVLDFADISRLFDGLPVRDQRTIAEGLQIVLDLSELSKNQQRKAKAVSPLARWLEQLTVVRNTCAHHGRLWNTSFVPASTTAMRAQESLKQLPHGESERVFGSLIVMSHILRVTSPGTTWPNKTASLVNDEFLPNPLTTDDALGLPPGWGGSL